MLNQTSAFMLQQYGKEPLWLWTKAGDARVRRWLESYARHIALRMTIVGGERGVDGTTGMRGSGFPIGPVGAPPFSDGPGWAEWVATLPLKAQASRTSFDGASLHTTLQTEGLLLFARDVGIDVGDALTAMAGFKAATKTYRYEGMQSLKHMGAPE